MIKSRVYTDTDQALRWLEYRVKILPSQLEKARLKLRMLEDEARALHMYDLLEPNSSDIEPIQ